MKKLRNNLDKFSLTTEEKSLVRGGGNIDHGSKVGTSTGSGTASSW